MLTVEQAGGRIVCDNLWSGLAPYLNRNVTESTMADVANSYLERVAHPALPCYDSWNDPRLASLKRLVRDYAVDGVIYHSLRYCDSANFKVQNTKAALLEEGIPLLNVHMEYSGSDSGTIRTRVETFVEMLEKARL